MLPVDSDVRVFSSNDYLSLSRLSTIKRAYRTGFLRYPTGSGGSMVVCGYHPIHRDLEQAFAQALGVDDALLFSSGYAANLSVLRLLNSVQAHLYIDKSIHASIYDGIMATQIPYTRYVTHDFNDLTIKIQTPCLNGVILTESVFSMSGHIPPLKQMALLSPELLVDEAHGFGVLGQNGLGGVVAAGLTQAEVPLRIIPLGKAFAAMGAVVAGDGAWIDALLQTARPYIYSTAISPALSYGILKTLEIIQEANDRREKLFDLVHYFQQQIQSSHLRWQVSQSPIQQLQIGCPHQALSLASYLQKHNLLCLPMRKPTVSAKETGLRIILNYEHGPQDIDYLLQCIHDYPFD